MHVLEPVKIFVVEDDPTYTKFLSYVLGLNPDFDTQFFATAKECLDNLYKQPSVITLDYTLPDMRGEKALQAIREFNPDINVIIVSAQDKIGTAVELLKAGAFDYISKDEGAKDRILNSIKNARNKTTMIREIGRLQREIAVKYDFEKSIIGKSVAIKKVFENIERAVKTLITVSISGETGTGKELIAKAIHYSSKRKSKPFVAVNVAAIPKELIESELFGHEKGAFTGATQRRIGKFEEANGGTLFLDEIGEMDFSLQAKLLRVLQEKELTRLGGSQVQKLDVRIVVATNRNLQDEVRAKTFREDLYYRLLGLPIYLPPLRERGHDILLIAKHFLDKFTKENQMPGIRISDEAQKKLLGYGFPGNVRELKAIVELAAVLSDGHELKADDISLTNQLHYDTLLQKEMSLQDFVYHIVRSYLKKYDGNVVEVAKRLDIGKSSIYRYLKEMEVAGI